MDVSILEEFQSRGYGTQALRTLFGVYMAESRKHLGVKEFLACVGKDKRPIPFYQRLGFKKQGDVDHGGELFFVSSDAIKRSKEKSR
jgi:L-amino acid N-acyltransferase YncA